MGATILGSCEFYDPATAVWTDSGTLNYAREVGFTSTLLPNGKVLVAGGQSVASGTGITDKCEIYDPATGTWTPTGSMAWITRIHQSVLLSTGKVLATGGDVWSTQYPASYHPNYCELYNPATGTWSPTGSMFAGRSYHTLTLLPDGTILAVGGVPTNGGSGIAPDVATCEVYDPGSGSSNPGWQFSYGPVEPLGNTVA